MSCTAKRDGYSFFQIKQRSSFDLRTCFTGNEQSFINFIIKSPQLALIPKFHILGFRGLRFRNSSF